MRNGYDNNIFPTDNMFYGEEGGQDAWIGSEIYMGGTSTVDSGFPAVPHGRSEVPSIS